MAKKKQVLKQKIKKKRWFPLYTPKIFNNVLIGESYLETVDALMGKYININLSTVVNDMKKQHISLSLRVNRVIEGKGYTEVIGMHILQSHLKRLVRRGRTKIDDSFTVKTKEGILVRVKPLIITSTNCTRGAATELRTRSKEWLIKHIESQTFMVTFADILSFKLQKDLKSELGKLLPVRSIDIRVFERERIRGVVPNDTLEEPKAEAKEEEKAEKPKEEPSVPNTEKAPAKTEVKEEAKAEPAKAKEAVAEAKVEGKEEAKAKEAKAE